MITPLLIEEGHAGYGVYWMILELMRDCQDYRIGDNAKSIAWAIHCQDVSLVQRVLHNFGLFDHDDDGLIWSPWLLQQMDAYDQKKKKLQEAGRRGAAKRFGEKREGEAIATPINDEGEAKAILHNVTQCNVTELNVTSSTGVDGVDVDSVLTNQGGPVSLDLLEAIGKTQPSGHAPGYLAQVCIRYGMGEAVLEAMQKLTDNASLSNSRYKALVAKIKDMEAKKWRPQMPANFFLRFLTKQK